MHLHRKPRFDDPRCQRGPHRGAFRPEVTPPEELNALDDGAPFADDDGDFEGGDPRARWSAFGHRVREMAREFAGRDDWFGDARRGPRPPHPEHGPHGMRGRFGRGGRFFENGMLRLVILALIAETPRHGYELIKDIEERTGGAYAPSPGVVYPTLTLLEETGEIEAAASEGNKRLFSITDKGRATVEENRAAIDAVLARFAEANRQPTRNPRLVRAVENLRLALRLKAEGSEMDADTIGRLADLLDDTARKIEAL